ncbi:ankyrin repeat domain-containing protein [Wolbachia endosymbiont (group E) of Neria commutata]|uniref:ankyrin repeat domain-containing protein n=1 Tax=Wolbachia endosymbiont (group E) of Neria commutata TaxID=3066149 RepID=UPI003132EF40
MANDISSLNRQDSITKSLTASLVEKNTLNSLTSVEEEDELEQKIVDPLITKGQELKLTENQKKLNSELLDALENLNVYSGVYNFYTDYICDRPGALTLKEFLNSHKDDQDLKIVLDLRREESEETILHDVADFNIEAVDLLLTAGADPSIKNKEGKIPLHYAANSYCHEAVKYLLDADADPNIQDKEGKIPLHYAANSYCHEAVKYLLDADADPNIQDKEDKTPLHYAAHVNCSEAVKYLLDADADPNIQDKEDKTPLHYAAEENSEDAIITLLNKGAKVDIQDKEGNTPLHNAARCGDFNVVELLTEKNPDINLKNKNGDTALHLALNSKDTRVPESILGNAKSIDFNIRDNKGDTTLLLTASLAQVNVLREILKQGADIKCVNSEGNTALHYATYNSHTGGNCKTTKSDILSLDNDPLDSNSNDYSEDTPYKCVDELIYAGIDVNVKNHCNQTPLFFATEANNIHVTELLLEKGADIKVQDKNGYTPLHYAIKIRSLKMLKALLPCKIDYDGEYGVGTEEVDIEKAKEILVNIRDNEGNTLLHHAVKYGCSRGMLNFLVESGIDINAKNKNGLAPIHIAAKYGHAHLIDFFIENKADINVQCGNFTKSEIDITEKNFINVQDESEDESSVIDVKNDTTYKDASPISITVENNHENATGQLLSRGAKPNIGDYRGWTPIYIAIRAACDENCKEEEREKAYRIIEKLAVFSNGIHLSKKAEANERIKTILENAMKSKDGNKLPTAPVDEYVPSVPPLDDDFYDKIGSYVKNIPELCLYPSHYLSEKLEENTIDSRDEEKSIQKIDSVSKMRFTFHDREKLNIFSDKVAKSKDIAELNQVVSEALNSGVRLNFLNNKDNSFTNIVMLRIQELKENSKISSNIICNLVSKGADINSYEKINQELEEVFKDHKTNIKKAYLEANKRIDDFHKAVASATTGKIELIEIDNTTFYLECSADSTVDVAKAIEAARGLGLYDGNITFGGNIVKIGKDEVEIETSNGTRNYTDLSDNGDVIITFQTSLGKLDVRLHNSIQHKDFIQVEVCNLERFNELIDIKEEIGKSCLFGRLSVYNAITQGGFKRSGKLQSSETISCKRPESFEVISQDVKAEEIIGRISSTDISSSREDSWANRIQGKRTNEGCSRGV